MSAGRGLKSTSTIGRRSATTAQAPCGGGEQELPDLPFPHVWGKGLGVRGSPGLPTYIFNLHQAMTQVDRQTGGAGR
jgi:hypothetical protein